MTFKLDDDDLNFLKKYIGIAKSNGEFSTEYSIMDDNTIMISNDDWKSFRSDISDLSVMFGMDSEQNNLTDVGRRLVNIYDEIVFQKNKSEAL
ncbi:MAG: hypothetical protein J6C96_03930 [Oscillospiraceae bacterium]|nr:hypothetical protein [Oscillospiraceae bacterium]